MRIPTYLLKQQATLVNYLGESAYGRSYSNPITIKCRIEPAGNALYSAQDTIDLGAMVMYTNHDVTINLEDKVTYNNKTYVVKKVRVFEGLTGPVYTEVIMQ